MRGAKVENVKSKIIEMSKSYNIRKIVIHVGGNNIPNDDAATLTNKIIDMLESTRQVMPGTKIFYSAIIPRTHNNYLPAINEVNKNIRKFCAKNGFQMIPHYQFYTDASTINFKLLREDIIHPTHEGTNILARNIIALYRNYRKYL